MSHFFAHLARMKLIHRWPLMRNVTHENVSEHSLQVAMVAHALTLIKNRKFGAQLDPTHAATIALFHDATEVLTGDLPTPVKYHNPAISREYKKIEQAAEAHLIAMLPPEFQDDYRPLIDTAAIDTDYKKIVKDADTLCAYIKCLEEESSGNHEFEGAKQRLSHTLDERMTDEMRYFIDVFIPSFTLTLDDIS